MSTAEPPSSRRSAPRGPRIAFLAAYMNNAYEWDVWRGARAVVEERGGIAVGFAGCSIDDPAADHQTRATVFDLVHSSNVDGILCLTSVVGQHAGVERTESWLTSKGLPVCCIGPAARLPRPRSTQHATRCPLPAVRTRSRTNATEHRSHH